MEARRSWSDTNALVLSFGETYTLVDRLCVTNGLASPRGVSPSQVGSGIWKWSETRNGEAVHPVSLRTLTLAGRRSSGAFVSRKIGRRHIENGR